MKFSTILATIVVSAIAATSATEFAPDATVPIVQQPEMYGPDADMALVAGPEASDVNATSAVETASGRELQAAEIVVAFQIAAAAAPLVAQIINGAKKECQQVACWISTPSKTCALSVAENVQAKMMMGRERYRYESIQANGMWARYWRTKFEPADRGDIASGKCSNGIKFRVTNCQSTGQVHC